MSRFFTSALLGWAVISLAAAEEAGESGAFPDLTNRSRYLLLDDRVVDRAEGIRLRLGEVKNHAANPLFGKSTFGNRDSITSTGTSSTTRKRNFTGFGTTRSSSISP